MNRDLAKKREKFLKEEAERKKKEEDDEKKKLEEKKKNQPKGLKDFLNKTEGVRRFRMRRFIVNVIQSTIRLPSRQKKRRRK